VVAELAERQHLLEQQLERALGVARLLGRRAPSAARSAPASPARIGGRSGSASRCSTIRSTTRYPRRRISSGGSESGPDTQALLPDIRFRSSDPA